MKKLPIGNSDFRDVIEDNYYFVDKSLFIKEVIDRGDKVLLIPRPRRFGKTLNMSMLKYFYGCNLAPAIGKTDPDNEHLFRHLNIWNAGDEYTKKQGKYPVVFISFKDVKDMDFDTSMEKIRTIISEEFENNSKIISSLKETEKEVFQKIIKKQSSLSELSNSLKLLMTSLATHYNQRFILLIDEYDSPVHASYMNGFYDEMINFMRNFLSAGLKDTSEYLEKAVVTGIMRVSRESIFSGLNNLGVYTILREEFSDHFGFSEAEVREILRERNALSEMASVKRWYDGYRYGKNAIYNPWSIINYAASSDFVERPYWVNTSQNAIIDKLLRNGGKELKSEIEILLSGESIEQIIQDDIVFSEIFSNEKMLWSFVLMGGYLKHEFVRKQRADNVYKLSIPNIEVERTFTKILDNYFQEATDYNTIEEMLKYLKKGEIEVFEEIFQDIVLKLFSYHDFGTDSEKVYHAFTAGLLVWLSGEYEVRSNRESGYGRYDIMLIPEREELPGFVIEFKKVGKKENREQATQSAIRQIQEKKYETELVNRKVKEIHKLAIVFEGKHVEVTEC